MLALHKAILDVERANYEELNGRVDSPHTMLQLVMHDPWFGWFRPISESVVQIDELLEAHTPPTEEADAQAFLREIRSLLTPTEEGEEFGVKYRIILQQDPEIILAHADIAKLLQK